MCTNGVNTGQFETMIEQIDDHVKLERRCATTWRTRRATRAFLRFLKSCTRHRRCSTTCVQSLTRRAMRSKTTRKQPLT